MEAITETRNWTECRDQWIVGSSAPINKSTLQLPYLWLRKHYGRGGWKECKSQKNTGKSAIEQSLREIT